MNPQDMQAVQEAMAARQNQQAPPQPQTPQVTQGMGYQDPSADPSQGGSEAPSDKELVILKALISRLNKYPIPGEQQDAPAAAAPVTP